VGRWIARCGGTRKRWQRRTVRSVPLLQEVVIGMQLSNIFIKLKNCILEDIYLHHQDDVLHPLLLTLQHFVGLVVLALAGPTGLGTGARMSLSGIGPTVHHLVTQSKPAIKVSIIN
jgi:hypothetical protein